MNLIEKLENENIRKEILEGWREDMKKYGEEKEDDGAHDK